MRREREREGRKVEKRKKGKGEKKTITEKLSDMIASKVMTDRLTKKADGQADDKLLFGQTETVEANDKIVVKMKIQKIKDAKHISLASPALLSIEDQ